MLITYLTLQEPKFCTQALHRAPVVQHSSSEKLPGAPCGWPSAAGHSSLPWAVGLPVLAWPVSSKCASAADEGGKESGVPGGLERGRSPVAPRLRWSLT